MRDDTSGTNGSRPNGMHARPAYLHDIAETVDLVAVQADDELINALAAGMTVTAPGVGGYDADDHVAAILAAWRAEVDEEPIPELVDVDTAIAAITKSRPRSRARHLAPVAAAAAFVVLAIGGVSVGSSDAQPGDTLWDVSKVLYSERATSVEAAARAQQHISSAKQALAKGQSAVAAKDLQQAAADLAAVRPQEGKAQLADVQTFLAAKADETPEGMPTDPAAPLKQDRQRKVPEGAAIGRAAPTTVPTPDPGPTSVAATPLPVVPASTDETVDPPLKAGPTSPSDSTDASSPASGSATTDPPTPVPTASVEGDPSTLTPTPGQGMGPTESAAGNAGDDLTPGATTGPS